MLFRSIAAKLEADRKQQNEAKDTVVRDKNGKLISFKHEGDWKKVNPKKNPEGKVHNLVGQALKKVQSLAKEEVELIDELTSDLLARYKEKAGAAAEAADKAKKYDLGHKRFKGILKATFKQFANDAKK